VSYVLVAQVAHLVKAFLDGRFMEEGVEFLDLVDGVSAQGRSRPLLFVEHLLEFLGYRRIGHVGLLFLDQAMYCL
jgi:hypothetical protein